MAVLGWFVLCIIALVCTVGFLLLAFAGSAFSSRFCWESLIPGVIAAVLWYIAYNHSPFVMVLLP